MAGSKHAHSKSGGDYCRMCGSSVGEQAKSQPTNVDGEIFCARCFVWHRMLLEPGRFQAHHIAAVRCQFCAWVSVCFSVGPGQMRLCGHCGRHGAMLLRMDQQQTKEFEQMIQDAIETAKTMKVTGLSR